METTNNLQQLDKIYSKIRVLFFMSSIISGVFLYTVKEIVTIKHNTDRIIVNQEEIILKLNNLYNDTTTINSTKIHTATKEHQ